MSNRLKPWFAAAALCASSAFALAVEDQPGARPIKGAVLLAYARDYQLELLVGQYDPRSGRWYPNTTPFITPEVNAPFTLFGVNGRLARVHLDDEFETPIEVSPWSWYASINPWDRSVTNVALALSDAWPDTDRHPDELPLNDPDVVAAVGKYLKEHHLNVSNPRITQALRLDLNGDGNKVLIICANVDNSTLTDEAAASIYYLSLLHVNIDGKAKNFPLRASISYKPAHHSLDEHRRYYGSTAFYQVLAFTDVAKDGHEQISIYNDDHRYGPEVDLYSYTSGKVNHLLSARMLYF